jgi:hypothetical protein
MNISIKRARPDDSKGSTQPKGAPAAAPPKPVLTTK